MKKIPFSAQRSGAVPRLSRYMDEALPSQSIAVSFSMSTLARQRLATLFDDHHERFYRLARRMLSDREEALEVVQETFLKATRHLDTLPEEDAKAEAWLVRVMINLCRDRYRRWTVREKAVLPAPEPTATDPEARAVARATVGAALAQLPPRRRAVLVLSDLRELGTAEVARLLGLREVTVRWHLMSARRQMEALLLADGGAKKSEADL